MISYQLDHKERGFFMFKLENEMTLDNLPKSNYIQVNTNFFNNPLYKDLSMQAVMLHALYTMRVTCSMYNSQENDTWKDEHNRFFIYFTNEEAADLLNISVRKVSDLRNDLARLGLIEVIKSGLKNYRIYVANPKNPSDTIKPKLAYKNTTTTKERVLNKIEQPVSVLSYTFTFDQIKEPSCTFENAESASSNQQNLLTSTEKQQVISKTTRETRETTVSASTNLGHTENSNDLILCEGLKTRYQSVLGAETLARIQQITKSDYTQTKWFIDTIFKAKFDATNRFRLAGLPADFLNLLTFEENPYFRSGLESALVIAFEQIYRYKKTQNPAGFFYTFLRGYFIERTKQYIQDHYELNPNILGIFAQVGNGKKQVQSVRV